MPQGSARATAGPVGNRKYWNEAEARRVVEAWRASGLTLSEYARRRGIHARRVSRWAARLDVAAEAEAARFHPVQLIPRVAERADSGGRIEIVLGEYCSVRVPAGFAALDLRRVLDVLQGRA